MDRTIRKMEPSLQKVPKRDRVAAYARVSLDKEAIPATLNRYTATPIRAEIKRRVAAYARVSTDDEEQLSSYENQVSYYTQYIQEHEGWVFAGMHTTLFSRSALIAGSRFTVIRPAIRSIAAGIRGFLARSWSGQMCY